ncbi:MAG: RNA 3'-terminal phosphate cyclase [Pseudomonadota bacterium]|uniref:RNA 3'-terminal phosphate cyclase n=1 Tax=Candidatus Desulfatibia profunda TaxID=2841695 RepID=A0A8J6NV93_9BACT|nr:RNA 3'-phosphate cyclase [Candidatus Desulfatibia profunda]MBL7180981.1 RNA 3'-phosphate cyclase [Desulfobacterales bacterium]
MITIDGGQKSGSGTIVRDAVCFSALTGKELLLANIRANRPKPGLRAQHLKGIEASAHICQGKATGATVGSREIRFQPGHFIRGGKFEWDIGTAGSTTMLALSVIPLALFADKPSRYTITGGLFQDFAPSIHHVKYVLLNVLAAMGIDVDIKIIRPGYVPKGNGQIEVEVLPVKETIKPLIRVDRGKTTALKGIALSSMLKERKVSERMAKECQRSLKSRGYAADIEILYDHKNNPAYSKTSIQAGASLAIWAQTDSGCLIGADMAGAPGRPAELIGKKIAHQLIEVLETEATVDEYVADQLIPFCALADGWSSYVIPKMTDHIESRLWLVEKILGAKTEVKANRLRVKGIGYRR